MPFILVAIVMSLDMGDTSVGSGGDTCGLRLSGELR